MNEQDQAKINLVLSELSTLAKAGLITKEQVLSVFAPSETKPTTPEKPSRINLQKILYYVGGFIVLIGIVIFVAQFWNDMDQFSKTLVTLGSAVSAYALGYYFYLRGSKDFGHAFLIISAALFPLGIGTTLDIIGISAMGLGGINIDIAILLIIYFISYYSLRASVFLPLTILAASALFFTFTNYLFGGNLPLQHFDQYRIAILGLSWLSFAYYFSQREMKFMTNVMYLFGLSMLLGSTASLQGHFPNASFFWENAFPVLIVLTFYASTKLQNRVFLVLAILFTIGEILYLTAEYSSSGLGWPLYRIAILGLSWLSFAYYFSKREMRFIPNVMYFFGLLMLLGSTASLQGYYPNASIFWELAFPFLIIAVFYGSIRIQSKIFLVLATLFTIGEILKLTAEYFSEGLGWPISLIVAGLIIMGVSYISFELNRRFLKPSSSISSVPSQT